MKTIAAILVATDFSEAAQLAIRRAAQLGQEHHADLEILHVVGEMQPEEEFRAPEMIDSAKMELAKLARTVVPGGVSSRQQVEQGKDFVAIIHRARQIQAGLIVIGAHGDHAPSGSFFGTTAQKLARKASIPLLVVKQSSPAPYRRMLVATDLSSASRQAMEAAMTVAPQAEIDLLHVHRFWGESRLSLAGAGPEDRSRYRLQYEVSVSTMLQEWLEKIDLGGRRVDLHVRQGHPASVISHLAAEREADLVVMGTTGRSGLPYILLGSVAEKVLQTVPCDALVVRPQGFRFELP